MPFTYVDSPPRLESLTIAIARARQIAIDTEANSLYRYTPVVCLIQLNVDGELYLVDPLVRIEFSEFFFELSKKPLILHDIDYDLRMMRSSFGFAPSGAVFDTKLAAQLLGYESFGLGAVIERILGVKLSKGGQKSNWTQRPLTAKQLAYACDDVRYLITLVSHFEQELRRLGRLDWHREGCERAVRNSTEDRPQNTRDAWRIRGSGRLNRKELMYLQQVWRWRDAEARKMDVPPFKIMANESLIDLAAWNALHAARPLAEGPRMPQSCTGRRLERLENALHKARTTPKAKWPTPPERKQQPNRNDEGSRARLQKLQQECARIAEEVGIAPALIAPKSTLEMVSKVCPDSVEGCVADCGMMRWQAVLLEPALARVLS